METEGKRKKKNIHKKGLLGMTLLIVSVGLSACQSTTDEWKENSKKQITVLKLATFDLNKDLLGQVAAFNEVNDQYQIQVEAYQRSEVLEEDGIAKLQREIMNGNGPDLIDFGSSYSTSDVTGGYTENLFPYLKRETEKNGEQYFENVLESFTQDGKLYAIPTGFGLNTFAGNSEMLGERDTWTIRELRETWENAPEGTVLYPGETKKDVFGTLLFGNLDYYVDWNRGTCRFDGEEFADMLEFAGTFPGSLRITDDYSAKKIYDEGGALLYQVRIRKVYDICDADVVLGEHVNYIGFPVKEDCGTVITATNQMLAISISSEHKEAAWEFIAGFLAEDYQRNLSGGLPISESVLEDILQENQEIQYAADADGNTVPIVKEEILFEGEEALPLYQITKRQAMSLLKLTKEAAMNSNADLTLYGIVLEEADAYFAGDKTLQETCKVIQGRAEMYVAERSSHVM